MDETEDDAGTPDEQLYEEALELFKKAAEAEADNRKDALDDLRFARLGEQWPEKIRQEREDEGRPVLTINRMPTFIRQVVNDSRQNKPSIKVHPVDDHADVKTAEIYNGLIRNIEVISNADIAYDTAIEAAVSCSFGYFRIVTDYAHDDTFDLDILIRRIANQFTVYGDPRNNNAGDGSDWEDAFVTEWMTQKAFKRRWPDVDVASWKEAATGDEAEHWLQGDDEVRVAEWWTRREVDRDIVQLSDGSVWPADELPERIDVFVSQGVYPVAERTTKSWQVTQHWIGGGQVLESVEWKGKYIPIVPVYGDEVNIEGKRHLLSLIRFGKDPQRMFNFWRTNATEMQALAPRAPFIGPAGSFDSDPGWATVNTKSHAYLEYDVVENGAPPQRQPFAGPAAGALQEAASAADDMKAAIGIYDASLGARSNETSGRAIMARQREGDVSTFHFIDNMTRAIRHAGRILVDLIPKIYDGPRVLRILGEDMQPTNVQVNQRIQQDDGSALIYDLTNGKYDVTVRAGPSYTTKREEFSNQITQLVQAFPQAAPLVMDMLAKAQDWPEADKIAARFRAMLPPQVLQAENGQQALPPQAQQMLAQLQQQLQQLQQQNAQLSAKVQSGEVELRKAAADLEMKRIDGQVKGAELEIARINGSSKVAEVQARMAEAARPQIVQPPPTDSTGSPVMQ